MFAQAAAYFNAFCEMLESPRIVAALGLEGLQPPTDLVIVRVAKNPEDLEPFEVQSSTRVAHHFAAFQAAHTLYKWGESNEENGV